MRVSIWRGERASMASGVSATAKSRSEAGPVVVSWVRSDRMHAMRTRKGSRLLHGDVAGQGVGAYGARVELQENLDLFADGREEEERAEHALRLAPTARVDRVPEVRVVVPRRELHRAPAELTAARVCGELLLGRRRADVAPEEAHVGEHDGRVDLALTHDRGLEQIARAVDRRQVLVIAREERPRLGGRGLR